MSKKILIVEDDRGIAEMVKNAVVREGYLADIAPDGQSALSAYRAAPPDLVVLDRGLPGLDGMGVLREIRRTGHVPVLVLTAKDQEDDKVQAFEAGADDYMTKPFGVRELLVRIRSLFRRSPTQTAAERVEHPGLSIQIAERTVTVDGKPIETTRTEFDLLLLLANNPGVVFSRERLLQEVWGYSFEGYERSVDSQVTRLRKKIETDPKEPRFIETVWGVGYRFRIQAA
jgi:DNA-binding response OmpR family regulator